MKEEKEFKCDTCDDRIFKSEEALNMHNSAKHSQSMSKEKIGKTNYKKIRNWGISLIVLGLVIYGIFFIFSGAKTLPPTDMQGHVESSPPSHILKEPMSIPVQKHMLEHLDGVQGERGGVIINYDCENYDCESGLVENLENFASYYNYVYVAPFKNMAAKIALTQLNRIEVLEDYDEEKIHIFISGRVPTNEELGIFTPIDFEEETVEVELIQETNIKEFDVIAKQWQFSPDTIEVNVGDTVILNVKSIDVNHGLAIPKLGIDEFLSPGNTVKIEFIANQEGTFIFACSVSCGVGHSGMRGKIIVS